MPSLRELGEFEVLRRLAKAREAPAQTIVDSGDDAAVLTQVANAIIDLNPNRGDFDYATGLIERATSLNPGLAHAWFIGGLLKLMEGSGREAVERFQRAARLDPISSLNESVRAHIGIGLALLGNFDEALRSLLTTSYRPPRVRLIVLLAHDRLGQFEQAGQELKLYEELTRIPAETMVTHMTRHMSRLPDFPSSMLEAIARARNA